MSVVSENKPIQVAEIFRQELEECGGSFLANEAMSLLQAVDQDHRVLANSYFWKAIDRNLLPIAVRHLKGQVRKAESQGKPYEVTVADCFYIQDFVIQDD